MEQFIQGIIIPGLAQGAIYGLIAVAFAVLHQTSAVINFAHGQLVVFAPIVILMFANWGVPVWLAFVLGIVTLVIAALVVEWATVRPYVQSGLAVSWILSTFGASVVIGELLAIPSNADAVRFPFGLPNEPFDLGIFRVTWSDLVAVPLLLVVAAALIVFYRLTRMGRELRAVGEDVAGAEAIGISKARASQVAMVIAAVIAALTGLLVASSQIIMPELGMFYLFSGFVAVAMGGMNSVPGAVIGGLAVGLVSQAASIYVGPNYTNLAMFLILILVYAFRPYGLFGQRPVREV